jgi:hypothetical protein
VSVPGGHSRAPLRQVLLHRRVRALERAAHGGHAGLERLSGLLCRAAEHGAQDQHRSLERDESLDGDEVCELDRLLRHDGRFRIVPAVGHEVVEQRVRIRLQPQHLARHQRRARVQAGVRRDLVQPRPQRGAALERVAAAPRSKERLLDEILGLLEGSEHPIAMHVQLAAMLLDAFAEPRAIELDVCRGGHTHMTGVVREIIAPSRRCVRGSAAPSPGASSAGTAVGSPNSVRPIATSNRPPGACGRCLRFVRPPAPRGCTPDGWQPGGAGKRALVLGFAPTRSTPHCTPRAIRRASSRTPFATVF